MRSSSTTHCGWLAAEWRATCPPMHPWRNPCCCRCQLLAFLGRHPLALQKPLQAPQLLCQLPDIVRWGLPLPMLCLLGTVLGILGQRCGHQGGGRQCTAVLRVEVGVVRVALLRQNLP